MESIRPGEEQPTTILGSIAPPPPKSQAKQSWLWTSFSQNNEILKILQWQTQLGSIAAPGTSLLVHASPIAQAPQPKGDTGKVIIDLSDRQVYLYSDRDSKIAIAQYDIAIGQDGWETPPGRYLIEGMQTDPAWQHPLTHEVIPPGPDNPLGAAWISFLTVDGYSLGLHGTIDESLVGQAVSHGCVRMRNADILELYDKVALGWPLDVQP